jgi:hypothetical protein
VGGADKAAVGKKVDDGGEERKGGRLVVKNDVAEGFKRPARGTAGGATRAGEETLFHGCLVKIVDQVGGGRMWLEMGEVDRLRGRCMEAVKNRYGFSGRRCRGGYLEKLAGTTEATLVHVLVGQREHANQGVVGG